VIAVPKAVSNKNGTVPLVFISRDPSQSSLYHYQGEDVSTIVEGITLDRFLDKAVIVDVIKMDIEGAELRALEGMEQTIARTNERVIMFVECNVSALYSAGDSATALVEWLTELGFTVMVIDEQNRRLSPVGSDIESVKCVNLYCCHEEMP
jgi:hypothetical protein